MYEIDQETIRFSNGKCHKFPAAVVETLEFDQAIVVRLAPGPLVGENIFGIDYSGKLLWRMPRPHSFEVRNPYMSLFRKGGYVEVLNWDGHLLTVHPKDGTILQEDFYTGSRSSQHRTSTRRAWI